MAPTTLSVCPKPEKKLAEKSKKFVLLRGGDTWFVIEADLILEEGEDGADTPAFACVNWEDANPPLAVEWLNADGYVVGGGWSLAAVKRALDFCALSSYSISDVTSLMLIYPVFYLSNIWKTVWYSPLSTLTY